MCVILVAEDKRLTTKMIKKAHHKNPDGLGLAWVDGDRAKYRKGLSLGEAIKMSKALPLPYVLHARWATEGEVTDELCHPFPVTMRSAQRTNGRAKRVLFHNGHWSDWKETVKRAEMRYDCTLPDGLMSDSRAMAWLVAVLGEGILEMSHGQKFAIVDATGVYMYGDGWKKWNGYMVSNTRWLQTPKLKQRTGYLTNLTNQRYQWVDKRAASGFTRRSQQTNSNATPKASKPATADVDANGFYTVPIEAGGYALVKAKSCDDAFKIASGESPGWRREMSGSEDAVTVTDKRRTKHLEQWLGEKGNDKRWQGRLLGMDPEKGSK